MISDKYDIGKLSSKQMQSLVKIAREAKFRTGKTVRLQDQLFFSKMAGVLQQAGETKLVQDLVDINREISVREDDIASQKSATVTAPRSGLNEENSNGFFASLLGGKNKDQMKKANAVTVKKYDQYKIKVKLFDKTAS